MSEEIIQKAPLRKKPGPKPRAAQIDEPIAQIDVAAEEPVAAARSPARSQVRTNANGRVEVIGRDGEVLSRSVARVGDVFDIPEHMIPTGWAYQWNAVSTYGNSEIHQQTNHEMHNAGWRAVPAERYAGTLVPKGSKGPIIRQQMMLMERPVILNEEAKQEEKIKAARLISDRNESLMLTQVKGKLPDGMEMGAKYRGTGGGVKMQIDRSLDVLNINQSAGNYQTDGE